LDDALLSEETADTGTPSFIKDSIILKIKLCFLRKLRLLKTKLPLQKVTHGFGTMRIIMKAGDGVVGD